MLFIYVSYPSDNYSRTFQKKNAAPFILSLFCSAIKRFGSVHSNTQPQKLQKPRSPQQSTGPAGILTVPKTYPEKPDPFRHALAPVRIRLYRRMEKQSSGLFRQIPAQNVTKRPRNHLGCHIGK